MNFYLVDDDSNIRNILKLIIRDRKPEMSAVPAEILWKLLKTFHLPIRIL